MPSSPASIRARWPVTWWTTASSARPWQKVGGLQAFGLAEGFQRSEEISP